MGSGVEARFERYTEVMVRALEHADRATPARWYLRGLMLPGERKSVEPMAARVHPQDVESAHQSMHHLVAASDWSDTALLRAVTAEVLPVLSECASGPCYWIIDDTSFRKYACRVASRNFFPSCLTENVTRQVVDEALDSVLPPYPHSLLKRMELAQVVPARVTGLELDEQFECGLIGPLVQTAHHLLPMLLEDLRAAAARFVTEPSIRFSGPNHDAPRKCISTPQVDPPQQRLVLPWGESAWKLDAQFVEELRRVDVGEAFKSPANDWPYHAKRLDPGLARLGVDGLQRLRTLRCGDVGWLHRK